MILFEEEKVLASVFTCLLCHAKFDGPLAQENIEHHLCEKHQVETKFTYLRAEEKCQPCKPL